MTSQDRANHLLSLDQQARRMNLSDAAREEILAGADPERLARRLVTVGNHALVPQPTQHHREA